ncbi:MAG: hypothetical protein V2I57_16570 [Xanthomonadales bacterium]|jgi:hypothetical protein|nr:hypothetical protein [Xanthomonadales bacterium]
MFENRIKGRVTIEFTQAPNGEVRPSIDVDDWIKHWADLSPETMAIARVPEAVIAARILADMCSGAGIEKALEFAAQAVEKARQVRADIDAGKKPMAGAGADAEEQESSVH